MRDATTVAAFVAGALAMGYAVAAVFFAKFWRRTGDRLFAWFAVAFVLLAVQRAALAVLDPAPRAAIPWSYALRLAAFVMILGAVAEANLRARRSGDVTQHR